MQATEVIVQTQELTTEDMKRLSPGTTCAIGTIRFPNPLGGDEKVTGKFRIHDGVAFGQAEIDGEMREVVIEYPLLSIINKSNNVMKDKIRQHLHIEEDRDVTIYEILSSYNRIKVLEKTV